MEIIQAVDLNLSFRGIPPKISMVQGDSNTRIILAQLWDGANPYTIPTGAAVMVRFRKPDGTGGLYDKTEGGQSVTVSGSTVTAPVATQMLTVAGVVMAEIDIYTAGEDAASAQNLASFAFFVEVAPSVYPDAEIISSDYYSVLTAEIASVLAANTHPPTIGANGNWYIWDQAKGEYVDSGTSAKPEDVPIATATVPGKVAPSAADFSVSADGVLSALIHLVVVTALPEDPDPNTLYLVVPWEEPVADGDTLAVTQVYRARESGEYLEVE